jgi:hypothetical protein
MSLSFLDNFKVILFCHKLEIQLLLKYLHGSMSGWDFSQIFSPKHYFFAKTNKFLSKLIIHIFSKFHIPASFKGAMKSALSMLAH